MNTSYIYLSLLGSITYFTYLKYLLKYLFLPTYIPNYSHSSRHNTCLILNPLDPLPTP